MELKNINDLLVPKSKEDIIKEFSNLSQEEKDKKLIHIAYEGRFPTYDLINVQLELVKLLIEAGANVNAKNIYGNTALIYASFAGQLKLIKYLISVGADINIKNNTGNNVLMIASNYNNKKLLNLLKKYGAKEYES
jgi:ankyrin repeat protein